MPSVSRRQHNFMEMIKHGGKPRSGKGPSQAVASDFVAADQARGKKALAKLPEKVGQKFSGRAKPEVPRA